MGWQSRHCTCMAYAETHPNTDGLITGRWIYKQAKYFSVIFDILRFELIEWSNNESLLRQIGYFSYLRYNLSRFRRMDENKTKTVKHYIKHEPKSMHGSNCAIGNLHHDIMWKILKESHSRFRIINFSTTSVLSSLLISAYDYTFMANCLRNR